MMMGSYNHTVDAKARLMLPAPWREEMGRIVYITLGMTDIRDGRCLTVMAVDKIDAYVEMFDKIPITDVHGNNMKRAILGNTFRIEVDNQGRILVPQMLRMIAAIGDNVMLVGMKDRIEIWDAATWEAKTNAYLNDPDVWLNGIAAISGDKR
ncbi:MAG: division/cell wall cluster transcriptional repressor MraZ [Clostridia bacterium]|nr:division/cell wall cluster transcriptional repressor MraZ [Clostridia bacterium]